MLKNIKILLRISGIFTIFRLIAVFLLIPFMDFYWSTRCVDFVFLFFDLSIFFHFFLGYLFSWLLIMFVPGLAVMDFLCASYIYKGSKVFRRIASYRSLITCLFGIFLIIVGRFVFVSLDFDSKLVIIEGAFYFLFYGTIFYLLMLSERKSEG